MAASFHASRQHELPHCHVIKMLCFRCHTRLSSIFPLTCLRVSTARPAPPESSALRTGSMPLTQHGTSELCGAGRVARLRCTSASSAAAGSARLCARLASSATSTCARACCSRPHGRARLAQLVLSAGQRPRPCLALLCRGCTAHLSACIQQLRTALWWCAVPGPLPRLATAAQTTAGWSGVGGRYVRTVRIPAPDRLEET